MKTRVGPLALIFAMSVLFCCRSDGQAIKGDKELAIDTDLTFQAALFENATVRSVNRNIQGVANFRVGYFVTSNQYVGIESANSFFFQPGLYSTITPSALLLYRFFFRANHSRKFLPFFGAVSGVAFADNTQVTNLSISAASYGAAVQQIKAQFPDTVTQSAQLQTLANYVNNASLSNQERDAEALFGVDVGFKYYVSRRFAVEASWRPTYQHLTPTYYDASGTILLNNFSANSFGYTFTQTGPRQVSSRPNEGPYTLLEKTSSTVSFGFSFLF